MKLTRFEFDNDGIFNALDYLYMADMTIDDKIDFDKVEESFEKNLKAPMFISSAKPYKFYFTKEGVEKFKTELETLERLFKEYAETSSVRFEKKIHLINQDDNIVYRDIYQMALS